MNVLKPSLRIKLEEVLKNIDGEKLILENIRRCARVTGRSFQSIFWYEKINENEIKNFVKRNQDLLFEINAKITKKNNINCHAWFIIDMDNSDKSLYRYLWKGDILIGLVKYIELINCLKKRELNET